ncbi:restriction endonuclease subunit S, partial [Avibacterium avium]
MKLSDIANITMGQSPSSEDVYSEVVGIPLLNGPTEFTDFSPIPKQYTNNGKKFAKNGDILFCVRGSTAGRMNFADQKFAIGRGIASIRGINGYPTEFIRVILENKLENILKSSTGSTFPNISRSQLLNLNIENINSNNANKIGLFYKYIYTKMELNTQTNQTLEQIAQAIFKHWFIDFAPVYAKANALARGETIEQAELAAMACLSGKTVEKITALKTQDPTAYHQLQQTAAAFPSEFVETEMGKVPRGWEVKPINEICRVVYGKGLPKNQLRASGYPVYGANGVIGYYDQYLYENRQVLVGCRGTVGQVYVSQPYSY